MRRIIDPGRTTNGSATASPCYGTLEGAEMVFFAHRLSPLKHFVALSILTIRLPNRNAIQAVDIWRRNTSQDATRIGGIDAQ